MAWTSVSGWNGRDGRLRAGGIVLVALALIAALTSPPAVAGAQERQDAPEGKRTVKDLPEHWRVWLEDEIYPLITDEQRKAFLRLETEAQRRAFADRLWVIWGKHSGLGSQFQWAYQQRLDFAKAEFNNTREDRARVLLIHGPPDGRVPIRCDDIFHPLDFWIYGYIPGLGENIVVLFYQQGGLGPYRLWSPFETRQALYTFEGWRLAQIPVYSSFDRPEFRCIDGEKILRLLASAEAAARDPKLLASMNRMIIRGEGGREGATTRFMEFSALVSDKAEPLPYTVTDTPRMLRGGLVQMGFEIRVPGSELGRTSVGDVEVVQIDVVGEISDDETMVDRFRYLFSVPATEDSVGLAFDRYVRPGSYTLRIKVEDTHSDKASVGEQRITARAPTAAELARASSLDAVAEEEVPLVTDSVQEEGEESAPSGPIIALAGPSGEGVTGLQRFEALVTREVQRVTFLVDEKPVLTKNRPPFDVDLDLGPLPRLTTVTAIAYGSGGEEIDRRQNTLNVGRERFFVRLQPYSTAATEGDRVRIETEVNIPGDRTLERLDLYWNDELLARLTEPPYAEWVTIRQSDRFGYLRALAVLDDGSQAEDLEFVNVAQFGSVVEVTSVELPVMVLDRSGRPVEDLVHEDFSVFEDGVLQELTHFSLNRDLPVRLGIVIDTSGSMEETLPEAQRVVMGFLRDILRPRDRAYIEIFSDRPEILAPFTADFGTLENALLALYPDRSTAFYDAVILGLFQFSGVRGRKAMVVLTDGADTASKHGFEEILDYSQRAGVTVYVIAVDLPASAVLTRWQLNKLAKVTGGRAFFLPREAELDRVYNTIDRELRTQYLLAFTSNSEKPAGELREIEVEVDRSGVEVRTISGYYPGGF